MEEGHVEECGNIQHGKQARLGSPYQRTARGARRQVVATPLPAYFVVTYLITWGFFFAGSLTPAAWPRGLLFLLGTFAPGYVALWFTSRETGRGGVAALRRRLVDGRVHCGGRPVGRGGRMARVCLAAARGAFRSGGRERAPRPAVGVLAPSPVLHFRRRHGWPVVPALPSAGHGAVGGDGVAVRPHTRHHAAGHAHARRCEQYQGHRALGRSERHESVGSEPLARGLDDAGSALAVRRLFPASNAQEPDARTGRGRRRAGGREERMRNLTRWSPGHARWSEARVRILAVAAGLCAWSCSPSPAITVQEGDIVFQTSRSAQSQAVQLATHSPYSHMGLVLFRDGKPFVFEAIARVQFTPFVEWIHRGEEGRYVVKRLRDPELLGDPARLSALKRSALAFAGRPYDPYFEWSDDRIYCSELVWKAYDRGIGVQLGSLARLSTFDLSNLLVKTKLAERYGDKVPLDERVISPAAVFASPLLQEAR